MKFVNLVIVAVIGVEMVSSAKLNQWQSNQQQASRGRQLQGGDIQQNAAPMNYDFNWNVDDEEFSNYYGHRESASEGRVEGGYYTWLPDGRLMKVSYYVDGDSGFVPTITYEDNYNPAWGTPPAFKR